MFTTAASLGRWVVGKQATPGCAPGILGDDTIIAALLRLKEVSDPVVATSQDGWILTHYTTFVCNAQSAPRDDTSITALLST